MTPHSIADIEENNSAFVGIGFGHIVFEIIEAKIYYQLSSQGKSRVEKNGVYCLRYRKLKLNSSRDIFEIFQTKRFLNFYEIFFLSLRSFLGTNILYFVRKVLG